jgi:Cu+-exporting ATPase
MKRIILVGAGAALLLLAFYSGILTLSQGVDHAIQQSAKLWYWLLPLIVGFGVQAGLFDFIRRSLSKRRAASASVATSGGISAGSMAACCAHHLSDVLPLLGLSGLAAFLVNYQVFFIVVGVMANIIGITIMLETIQRHSLCPVLARWQVNMARAKKGAMMSAGLVIAAALFITI